MRFSMSLVHSGDALLLGTILFSQADSDPDPANRWSEDRPQPDTPIGSDILQSQVEIEPKSQIKSNWAQLYEMAPRRIKAIYRN